MVCEIYLKDVFQKNCKRLYNKKQKFNYIKVIKAKTEKICDSYPKQEGGIK